MTASASARAARNAKTSVKHNPDVAARIEAGCARTPALIARKDPDREKEESDDDEGEE